MCVRFEKNSDTVLNNNLWTFIEFFLFTARIREPGKPIGQLHAGPRPYPGESWIRLEDLSIQATPTNTFKKWTRPSGTLKHKEGEEILTIRPLFWALQWSPLFQCSSLAHWRGGGGRPDGEVADGVIDPFQRNSFYLMEFDHSYVCCWFLSDFPSRPKVRPLWTHWRQFPVNTEVYFRREAERPSVKRQATTLWHIKSWA